MRKNHNFQKFRDWRNQVIQDGNVTDYNGEDELDYVDDDDDRDEEYNIENNQFQNRYGIEQEWNETGQYQEDEYQEDEYDRYCSENQQDVFDMFDFNYSKSNRTKSSIGWVAGRKIMEDAKCKCYIKTGLGCQCDSYDWSDCDRYLLKYKNKIKKIYSRGIIKPKTYYQQHGYTFCVTSIHYISDRSGPLIHIIGVDQNENSIMCKVNDFMPYFYIELENPITSYTKNTLKIVLEMLLNEKKIFPNRVTIDKVVGKFSSHGFRQKPMENLYRITLSVPRGVSYLRKMFYETDMMNNIQNVKVKHTYESNIDFVLRFSTDVGIQGMSNIHIPFYDAEIIPKTLKNSRCQIEFVTSYKTIKQSINKVDQFDVPGLRELSFDIECVNDEGHFPKAKSDPSFQICATLKNTKTKKKRYVGFTLGTCDDIVGKDTYKFKTEKGMLIAWSMFVQTYQPDIMTGYNIDKFDNDYLMKRAKGIKILHNYSKYSRIKKPIGGRFKLDNARIQVKTFSSTAHGTKEIYIHHCAGLLTVDLLPLVQRLEKYESYKLNYVSNKILGDKKDDVHYSDIPRLFKGNSSDRSTIIKYCYKDAELVTDILEKKEYIQRLVSMSQVTGTFIDRLIYKGATEKSKSLLLREANKRNILIVTLRESEKLVKKYRFKGAYVVNPIIGFYGSAEDHKRIKSYRKRQKYIHKGYKYYGIQHTGIDTPVGVLDFASLYPSIMIGYNLCYTTQITEAQAHNLTREGMGEGVGYNKTPCGYYFVTELIKKGLLPSILEGLLKRRKVHKLLMKKAKREGNSVRYTIENSIQLALKICANSIYGFTASPFYPNCNISESVTSYGQWLIKRCKDIVHAKFNRKNVDPDTEKNYEYDCRVVYGDTDSLMIFFHSDIDETIRLCKQAGPFCCKEGVFPKTIDLAYEQVYYPAYFMKKKMYFGMKYVKSSKDKPTLISKGNLVKRRDTLPIAKKLIREQIEILMNIRKVPIKGMNKIDYLMYLARKTAKDVYAGRVDYSDLIIRKGLNKPLSKYDKSKALPPPARVTTKIMKRNPGNEPRAGDRVPFVVLKSTRMYKKSADNRNPRVSDRVEDPEYAIKNRMVPDFKYYAERHIIRSTSRIFGPIFGSNRYDHIDYVTWDPEVIKKASDKIVKKNEKEARLIMFQNMGYSMSIHYSHDDKKNKGMIMQYLKYVPKCLGCKKTLGSSKKRRKIIKRMNQKEVDKMNCLCDRCHENKSKIFSKIIGDKNKHDLNKSMYRLQCMYCQEERYGHARCGNKECEIYYPRIQVVNDIEDIVVTLERLTHSYSCNTQDSLNEKLVDIVINQIQ